jgi:serine/threonine-protein kinase HipA
MTKLISPILHSIKGEVIQDEEIERLLNNLARAPLRLDMKHDFRISVAGAQEKIALLYHEGTWMRPYGVTPTTHIFKTQIGHLYGYLRTFNAFYRLFRLL